MALEFLDAADNDYNDCDTGEEIATAMFNTAFKILMDETGEYCWESVRQMESIRNEYWYSPEVQAMDIKDRTVEGFIEYWNAKREPNEVKAVWDEDYYDKAIELFNAAYLVFESEDKDDQDGYFDTDTRRLIEYYRDEYLRLPEIKGQLTENIKVEEFLHYLNFRRMYDRAYDIMAADNLASDEPCPEIDSILSEHLHISLQEYTQEENNPTVSGFLHFLGLDEELKGFNTKEIKNKFLQTIEYSVKGMVGYNHVTVYRCADLETGTWLTPRIHWAANFEDLPIQTVANFQSALNQAMYQSREWDRQ